MKPGVLRIITWQDLREAVILADQLAGYGTEQHVPWLATEEEYYKELLRQLKIANNMHDIKKRYRELCDIAEKALGYRAGSTRTPDNIDFKMILTKQLREEGYLYREIMEEMGYKDHSSVWNMVNKMKAALAFPEGWRSLIKKYEAFKKELERHGERNADEDGELV